jgi:hypothetical protein
VSRCWVVAKFILSLVLKAFGEITHRLTTPITVNYTHHDLGALQGAVRLTSSRARQRGPRFLFDESPHRRCCVSWEGLDAVRLRWCLAKFEIVKPPR